jgi:hypothetical protein
MALEKNRAAVKTFIACLCLELLIFLLFLAHFRNPIEALYWTVLVGPGSLFAAPLIYRVFTGAQKS